MILADSSAWVEYDRATGSGVMSMAADPNGFAKSYTPESPDIIAKMKLQGLHAMSSTPAELATLIASEVDHWAKVIPSIGIQPE